MMIRRKIILLYREQSSRNVWPLPAGCAARSALRFWEIAANVSELSRSLQKPLLALLPFFSACRWITEFVDLLTSQVNGLGRSFWAWLAYWRRSGQPQLDQAANGLRSGRPRLRLSGNPIFDPCQLVRGQAQVNRLGACRWLPPATGFCGTGSCRTHEFYAAEGESRAATAA
jgi:hypothetical protein